MKPILFKGSGVALVTPMDENKNINFKSLDKLLEFQIENQTDAIIICGTTGESATLSDEEKEEIIKFTVKKVSGKIPIIAGTGSNNTLHAVKLTKMAENLGCDGVLVVTPYYNKTSQEGLFNYYKTIANETKLPVIVYNVPSRTGLSIAPQTYLKLSEIENIIATKEASGDISHIAKVAALCKDQLMIYSGNDDQTLPVLSLGGIGVISVFANVLPKVMHEINNFYFEGNLEKAKELFLKHLSLMNTLFCDVNPIPVKEALNILGFNVGPCKEPLFKLSENNRTELKKYCGALFQTKLKTF